MTPNRWTIAITAGDLSPPCGPTLIMQGRGNVNYSDFKDITVVQRFKPDHDDLIYKGIRAVLHPQGRFQTALVHITKFRIATLSSIATALTHLMPDGILIIDGQKTEGIETTLKHLRQHFDIKGALSKYHGRVIWLTRPETLPPRVLDWMVPPLQKRGEYMIPCNGFSTKGPDRGSTNLITILPKLSGRIADFGAGWGYIAHKALGNNASIVTMDLVEADHMMVAAAKVNVQDPRAVFHWADVTQFSTSEPYDAILCNPPFHVGRHADPNLGCHFIWAAARNLKPHGRLFLVANRHLPYENTMKDAFNAVNLLGDSDGYKIYDLAKPKH